MKKILAIDDNSINLELLEQLIKLYYPKYQFLKANSGEEGIRIAKDAKPVLVLLDILMPGLDGYETCKILKKDGQTKHIPIIMILTLIKRWTKRIMATKLRQ